MLRAGLRTGGVSVSAVSGGLRQLAAAILIFSGSIAFFDTKFFPGGFSGRVLRRRCCFWCSRRISSPGPSGCGRLCVFCMGLTAAATGPAAAPPGPAAPAAGGGAVPFGGGFPDRRNIGWNVPDVRFSDAQRPADGTGPGGCLGAAMGLCLGLLGDEPDLAPMAVLGLPAPLCPGYVSPLSRCVSGHSGAIGGGCTLLFGTEEPLCRMIELFSGGILSLLPLPRLSLPPEKKRSSRKSRPGRTAWPSPPPPCGTCTTASSGAPLRRSRRIHRWYLTGRRSRCAAGASCGIPAGGRITAPPTTPLTTPAPGFCSGERPRPGIFPCISPPGASICRILWGR